MGFTCGCADARLAGGDLTGMHCKQALCGVFSPSWIDWTCERFRGVRTQIQGRLSGHWKEVVWPPFLCLKVSKNTSGVTAGVTKWGYIFEKVGLHIRGFRGVDRGGGKGMVLRDSLGETAHLRYRSNERDSG